MLALAADTYNASEVLDRNLHEGRGDNIAYVASDATLSYDDLRRQVNRFGHLLRGLGVGREERVLLVLDDTRVFPVAFLGAIRIGAVPIPVSPPDRADNLRHYVADSYARVVVCDPARVETLRSALVGEEVRFVARGGDGVVGRDSVLPAQDDELDPAPTHRDDMAFWLYSSGSTGKPKGVVHLQHDIAVTCESFAGGVPGISEEDRVFSTTKLYHAYGLGNALSFPLHFGATAVLLDGPPAPERLAATLRAH